MKRFNYGSDEREDRLFVGAVVLAIGYEFFLTWIYGPSRHVRAATEENEPI